MGKGTLYLGQIGLGLVSLFAGEQAAKAQAGMPPSLFSPEVVSNPPTSRMKPVFVCENDKQGNRIQYAVLLNGQYAEQGQVEIWRTCRAKQGDFYSPPPKGTPANTPGTFESEAQVIKVTLESRKQPLVIPGEPPNEYKLTAADEKRVRFIAQNTFHVTEPAALNRLVQFESRPAREDKPMEIRVLNGTRTYPIGIPPRVFVRQPTDEEWRKANRNPNPEPVEVREARKNFENEQKAKANQKRPVVSTSRAKKATKKAITAKRTERQAVVSR
jgi:hypothetical protein